MIPATKRIAPNTLCNGEGCQVRVARDTLLAFLDQHKIKIMGTNVDQLSMANTIAQLKTKAVQTKLTKLGGMLATLASLASLTACQNPDLESVTGVSSTAEYANNSGNSNTTSNAAIGALLMINGNNQTVTQGQPATKSLTVLAVDSSGLPKSGVIVGFEAIDPTAGLLTGGESYVEVTTGANGRASVGFSAGNTLGATTVIATSSTGSAVFSLMIGSSVNATTAGSILLATAGNNQGIPKGTIAPKALEVLALNSTGAAMPGVSVTFDVVTTGMGTLTGGQSTATVTTNANGRASIIFTGANTEGPASVVASSNAGSVVFSLNLYTPGGTNSSGSVLMLTGGNNQTVEPSSNAPKTLEVMALNSLGIPMQGVDVNFEILTTGAGLFGNNATTETATTGSNGRASVTFASSSSSGSVSIIARSVAGNAVFTLQVGTTGNTVSSGSTLLAASGNNQTVVKNAVADKSLEVLAINHLGVPIPGVSVTFEVITSGAGTLTGGTSGSSTNRVGTTDANGRLSMNFTAGNTSGGASVVARSSAGSTVFNLNITDSASTNTLGSALLITGGNNQVLEQSTTAPMDLEVLAVNSNGSAIPNISVTFQVSSGTFSGGGTTKTLTTDANGRASTGFTPGTQLGPISVIATSSAGSNVFNLTVGTQGAGSTISISGGNGQLLLPNSNASSPLEVIATNSTGAPVQNIPVTFTVTTTNGGVLSASQLASVTVNTDTNGKASTTFRSSNYVGSVSILASSQIGSVTFSLNTNTVTGGSGGSGQTLVFSPNTLTPATGTWLKSEVGNAPSKSVTLTNASATNLYLNSIFTTTQVPFKVTSDDCPRSPTAFAPNASCTINVQFAPQAGGTFNRSLFVNWSALNDGSNGTNAVLSLEGSGPEPLIFAGLTNASNTTTTQTQLNWVAASGGTNTQYRIYDTTTTATLIATLPPNTTSYTVTGLIPNSVYKYKAYAVNTAGAEDGNTSEITITTGAMNGPALTTITNFVYPATYVRASYSNLSADINSSVTNSDTGPNGAISYACSYSRVVNGSSALKVNCTQGSLGGTFTFSTTTGQISWTPQFGTQGVFEFQITGTDTVGSTSQYFTVNVIHAYGSASQGVLNLATILADYRASFANRTQQNASTATSWLNTLGNAYTAVVTGNPNFNGSSSNTNMDPERFTFDGSTQVDFGTVLGGMKSFMVDYWVSNPESTFANGSKVLSMDSANSDNGFSISQNTMENGQRALRIDFERSYRRAILSDYPTAYWRMDEGSGSTIDDVIGSNDLTIADTSNAPTTANVVYGQGGATLGETASTSISIHTNRITIPNVSSVKAATNFSVEMWVKYNSRVQPADHDLYNFSATSMTSGFSIQVINGVLTVKYKPASAATVTLTQNPNSLTFGNLFDSNWHHLVFTSSANNKVFYFDGMVLASDTANNGSVTWPATPNSNWVTSGGDSNNPVMIDEVAYYDTALTSNQVLNHLAAGDHFVPKQTYYPANTQLQSRPMGFWRFNEPWHTQQVTQDYSGNQADGINWNSWTYYTSEGPYVRTGGSGLDLTGASRYAEYYIDQDNLARVSNNRHLSFDQKFTFSEWVNFYYTGTDRRFPIFNTRNVVTGTNNFGITAWADRDGRILFGFNCTYSTWCTNYLRTASAVVPSYTNWAGVGSLNNNLRSGWTHLAMTFDGTQPAANRVQVYINGVAVKMAAPNGTIPSSLSALTGPINTYSAYDWQLNGIAGGSGRIFDSINYFFADLAIYGRALSASEIRAQAYEGSMRYCDIPITTTLQDPSNSKPFEYINMLFNTVQSTGQLQVYRNSKLECALRPGVTLTSESLNLIAGSTSNGFRGHVTDLRVHGSADNTVATISNTHKAFMNSAEQHRVVQLGNIVTDNLVRAYEPSTAMDGMRPFSIGNEDSKLQWQDNGNIASGTRQEPGYLRGFSGYNGKWNGTGSPTDPFRLSFDGNGWVDLGTTPLFELSNKNFTVCLWEKTTQSSNSTFFHKGNDGTNFGQFAFGTYSSQLFIGVNTSYWYSSGAAYNTTRNGLWHHICARTDGTNASLWLDGTRVINNGFTSVINSSGTIGGDRMGLGYFITRRYNANQYGGIFVGDMGGVHIYNSALTDAQIKQNCAVQAANYNMTTCNTTP